MVQQSYRTGSHDVAYHQSGFVFANHHSKMALRRTPTLWRRNLSVKTHPPTATVSSRPTLPAHKMRALISLYHQADSWVTPENLLQRIDEAFLAPDQATLATVSAERIENMVSVSDLRGSISLMRNAPKMAQWDFSPPGSEDRTSPEWSESGKNKRDIKVIEALYGVEATASHVSRRFLPGLEVLEESASSAIQDHNDDRDAEDLQDLLRTERSVKSSYT